MVGLNKWKNGIVTDQDTVFGTLPDTGLSTQYK